MRIVATRLWHWRVEAISPKSTNWLECFKQTKPHFVYPWMPTFKLTGSNLTCLFSRAYWMTASFSSTWNQNEREGEDTEFYQNWACRINNYSSCLRISIHAVDSSQQQTSLSDKTSFNVFFVLARLDSWIFRNNTSAGTWSVKQDSVKWLFLNFSELSSV